MALRSRCEDQRASTTRRESSKVSTSNTVTNASHLLVIYIQVSPTGIILIQAVWGKIPSILHHLLMDEELAGALKRNTTRRGMGNLRNSLFCTDVCIENYLVMFAYRPQQIAQKDYKTMKMKNTSACQYMQLHITLCKARLKLKKNKL